MRPKYPTRAIVLARSPLAEESALITLITDEVGLVRARAQGVRKSGAKLAASLATLAESDVVLVAGKEGWRLSGATLVESWFKKLSPAMRKRAGHMSSLLLRLVHGESPDPALLDIFKTFLSELTVIEERQHDALECRAALQVLAVCGVDAGTLPTLEEISKDRVRYVARVNHGIEASGL
jgi:DNA repair protein RecO